MAKAQKIHSEDNVLKTTSFENSKGGLCVPIGKTEDGVLVVEDLRDIPHLLVAGCTGSGKSAFVKTIITTAIKESEESVHLMIFDSNTLEYMDFERTPQMLHPIAKDSINGGVLIKTAAGEVKNRLALLGAEGCKDTRSYNRKCEKSNAYGEKLSEIVLILDDFSHLTLSKDTLFALLEILRNGRAAGVHAIVVSSIASTKVLSKELLSYLSYRAVFRVLSKAESKLLLDIDGAETLHVPGELYFKKSGEVSRCICAFATDENISRVLKAIAYNTEKSIAGIGDTAEKLFRRLPVKKEEPIIVEYDSLISEAAAIAIRNKLITPSTIQRGLQITYDRANRIFEELVDLGVVSKQLYANAFPVIMTLNEWNKTCKAKGLKEISNIDDITVTTEVAGSKSSEGDNEERPDIKMRDFAYFSCGKQTVEIHDNKIQYDIHFKTKYGWATGTPSFNGKVVEKIIVKKPQFLSKGYVKFIFRPGTNLILDDLGKDIGINENNVSEYTKIVYGSDTAGLIDLFVKQISEDCGIKVVESY